MSVDVGRGRTIAIVIAAAIVLALAGRLIDVPRLAGKVKGDEATYVAMTLSLAHDGDLRYEPKDLARFQQVYRQGPSGVLPQANAHGEPAPAAGLAPDRVRPHAGVVGGAPVVREGLRVSTPGRAVRALGGLGGMLMLQRACCSPAASGARCASVRRASAPGPALILGVAFVVASVVPVFGVFLTSEIFNFSLVLFAYFLWLYKTVRRRAIAALAAGPLDDDRRGGAASASRRTRSPAC